MFVSWRRHVWNNEIKILTKQLKFFVKMDKSLLNKYKWHTARKSSKKKSRLSFFLFFFIYMKDQVKKSLSLVGNKIKSFILIDIGETRKKRFLDLFWWIFIKKNNFFFQSYFFGKLDMQTKNYNFRMHKGSKTPKIDFFTYGFFVGIQLLGDFF